MAEFGKEKSVPLKGRLTDIFGVLGLEMLTCRIGLDDKAIESKVTELVKTGI